jgi:hypothetical protein
VKADAAGLGVVAFACLLAAHDTSAEAQDARPPVSLSIEGGTCAAAPIAELLTDLRIELLVRLVYGTSAPPGAYLAVVSCSPDIVTTSVTTPEGMRRSNQTDLRQVPANVRSRVVALTVAELVHDLDREPPPPGPPPLPPPLPVLQEQPATPPAPLPALRSIELGAFATASDFLQHGLALEGGGIRFVYARGPLFAGIEMAALTATEHFEPGTVHAVLSYGSPYVGWQQGSPRFMTRLGAAYAVGAARLGGAATAPTAFASTVSGAWAAPYLFGEIELGLWQGLRLYVRGQLGWVVAPVTGQVAGTSDVALEGLWGGVNLGTALEL